MPYSINSFLNKYRELEQWAHDNYSIERMEELENQDLSRKTNGELRYFRSIRNVLTHNINGDDCSSQMIQLTEEFEKRFSNLCQCLMEPQTVMEIAISGTNIYKRELSDLVMPTIRHMHEKVYTHVPIMMNKKVWGVFSEDTLFELASENKLNIIDENQQFFKLDCCKCNKSNSQVYDFISSRTTIEEVRIVFKKAVEETRKLDILFITDTGDENGKLLGLITTWDMAGL